MEINLPGVCAFIISLPSVAANRKEESGCSLEWEVGSLFFTPFHILMKLINT